MIKKLVKKAQKSWPRPPIPSFQQCSEESFSLGRCFLILQYLKYNLFYQTIEWAMLEQKQIPPPYRPRLENERDLANFPPEVRSDHMYFFQQY